MVTEEKLRITAELLEAQTEEAIRRGSEGTINLLKPKIKKRIKFKTIENKLANQEGVGQAVVDFESKIATVKFDAKKQSLESLTTTIEAVAGGDSYKVTESKKM